MPPLQTHPATCTEHDAICCGISLGQLGSAVLTVFPTNSTPASSSPHQGGSEKSSAHTLLCVSTAQPEGKHPYIVNTVFSTTPKHTSYCEENYLRKLRFSSTCEN